MYDKRGQLTLFVIVAIVLVLGIFVYFYYQDTDFLSNDSRGLNFDSCVASVVAQRSTELARNGGGMSDGETGFMYRGVDLPYYCYTNDAYKTCTVQRPLVKQVYEANLEDDISNDIQGCYDEAIDQLTAAGYNVTTGQIDLNITIIPTRMIIDIVAPTTIAGSRFVDYRVSLDSPMYELLMIATGIVQSEAALGDASTGELMLYYPNVIVDKFKQSDSTTIYVITDKVSDTVLQFASRSLIWPAGYDKVGATR
ncbi:MAG: hypothetical protein ACI83O_000561 [Patescibacteria group bacterium]|jgi:hypothetical protein